MKNAILNMSRAVNYLQKKIQQITRNKEYVGQIKNRSSSDNGLYIAAVQEALNNYKSFSRFKRNHNYQCVLEHVSYSLGGRYLEIINRDSPALLNMIDRFKENDIIGSPQLFEYPNIGYISPTTLR